MANEYKTDLYKSGTFECRVFANEEEWLAGRMEGIGGSEAASVIGLNPWKSNDELWREKTGRKEPDQSIGENPLVIYGKEAEEHIRQLFMLDKPQYEMHYLQNVTLRNKEYPFIQYSPDGLLLEKATGRKGIFECKTSSPMSAIAKKKWENGIPDNYFAQVIHGLITTGYEFIEVAAQLKYNEDFKVTRYYHIELSEVEDDMEYLLNNLIAFYNCIETDTEPPRIINI